MWYYSKEGTEFLLSVRQRLEAAAAQIGAKQLCRAINAIRYLDLRSEEQIRETRDSSFLCVPGCAHGTLALIRAAYPHKAEAA